MRNILPAEDYVCYADEHVAELIEEYPFASRAALSAFLKSEIDLVYVADDANERHQHLRDLNGVLASHFTLHRIAQMRQKYPSATKAVLLQKMEPVMKSEFPSPDFDTDFILGIMRHELEHQFLAKRQIM